MHEPLLLHIGGEERQKGWTLIDIQPGPDVDIVADCTNLRMLRDGSCAVIYASHVIEHLGFREQLPTALKEFFRLLIPHGRLMLSVPDMDVLCHLYLNAAKHTDQQAIIMAMIFGAQSDTHDFHKVGLNGPYLAGHLHQAGFVNICRVPGFGRDDTSEMAFDGTPISLNMTATKPGYSYIPQSA